MLYPPGQQRPRYLYMHLGPSTRHTVYEAEIVATILGLELLRTERQCINKASIALDNTAAIQASTLHSSAPGCCLTDVFHRQLEKLKCAHPGLRLTLRWVPGHDNIPGNENADAAVKEAAAGRSSPSPQLPLPLRRPLPLSASRARQNFATELQRRASARWKVSRRGIRMMEIDSKLPLAKYDELIRSLPRRHANLLLQLCTSHVPLNKHLARIGRVLSETCPMCGEAAGTVAHFLLACPSFAMNRATHYAPLGFSGRRLKVLLNSPKAVWPLFNYVNSTARFWQVFGTLTAPDRNDNGHNG